MFSAVVNRDADFGASLTITPPQDAVPIERSAINPGDLCAGCIVWLPRTSHSKSIVKCVLSTCSVPHALEKAGYHHPVVVLKIHQAPNSTSRGDLECDFACVSSFGNTTLSRQYTRKSQLLNVPTLPIQHNKSEEAAPPIMLELERQKKLVKQSYVRLDHVYRVKISNLMTFSKALRAYSLRLTKASYTTLMQMLDLQVDTWHCTNRLWETANVRLDQLMVSNVSPWVRVNEDDLRGTEEGVMVFGEYNPDHLDHMVSENGYIFGTSKDLVQIGTIKSLPRRHDDQLTDESHSTRLTQGSSQMLLTIPPMTQPRIDYGTHRLPLSSQPPREPTTILGRHEWPRYLSSSSFLPMWLSTPAEPRRNTLAWYSIFLALLFTVAGAVWWWKTRWISGMTQ